MLRASSHLSLQTLVSARMSSMRTALVTGAARGIGKAIAQCLAENDFYVYAGVRDVNEEVDFGPQSSNIEKMAFDVTSDEQIESGIDKMRTDRGSLDVVINNAGLARGSVVFGGKQFVSDIPELDREKLLLMFNVNSIAPMMVAKFALPLMGNPKSFIVNISSKRASYQDDYNEKTRTSGYRASKLALNMFTKCLVDYLPENVQTFAVHPEETLTEMNPNGIFTADQTAKNIYALMNNFKPELNGQFLNWDGTIYPV